MTQNQIAFLKLQEEQRSNLAVEAERMRSNLAQEAETNRHNLVQEMIGASDVNARYYATDVSRLNALTNAEVQRYASDLNAQTSMYNTRLQTDTQRQIADANRMSQAQIATLDRQMDWSIASMNAQERERSNRVNELINWWNMHYRGQQIAEERRHNVRMEGLQRWSNITGAMRAATDSAMILAGG